MHAACRLKHGSILDLLAGLGPPPGRHPAHFRLSSFPGARTNRPLRIRRFELGDVLRRRGFDLRKIRIEPLHRITAYCRQIDVPFVDLRAALGDARCEMVRGARDCNPLYFPSDYAHLNEQALYIAAEQLLRRINALGGLLADDPIL